MTRSLPPSRTRLTPASVGKCAGSSSVKACVEPESNHTSRMSRTCSHSPASSTRPSRKRSLAPSSNHTSAPLSANACVMRAINSFDLANLPDGMTSPVSLLRKTVIGTPQARWRDTTQSGRPSTMPRIRFSPDCRHPFSLVDGLHRQLAQGLVAALGNALDGLVHGDEPLRRVAEDDRLLRAPGVRILVLQAAARDERTGVGQRLDDGVVGVALVALVVEHALALEAGRVLGEDAVGIDGEGNGRVDAALFQLGAARHPDDVVVGAVARCSVHEAGARIVGDVIAVEQRHVEVVAERRKRMGDLQAAEHPARTSHDSSKLLDLCCFHDVIGELVGKDELIADLGPVAVRVPS